MLKNQIITIYCNIAMVDETKIIKNATVMGTGDDNRDVSQEIMLILKA